MTMTMMMTMNTPPTPRLGKTWHSAVKYIAVGFPMFASVSAIAALCHSENEAEVYGKRCHKAQEKLSETGEELKKIMDDLGKDTKSLVEICGTFGTYIAHDANWTKIFTKKMKAFTSITTNMLHKRAFNIEKVDKEESHIEECRLAVHLTNDVISETRKKRG